MLVSISGLPTIKGIVFNPDGTKVASVSRPTRTHYHGTEIADYYLYPVDNDSRENLYHRLIQNARASPPGSNGLVVFPHLRGCFTPHNDPISKGAILGLRTTPTHNEIARAVFEGLALEFRVVWSKFMELTNDHYPQVTCKGC